MNPDTRELHTLGYVETGGAIPRGFTLYRDGAFLVVAHQESNTATALRIDAATGLPGTPSPTIPIASSECVIAIPVID